MGEFPIMTPEGTFVVNGTERVVVSQLVRSPGVYFSVSTNTTGNLDVRNNKAQIIPSRGSYLEFLTEWVKDDRKSVSRFGKPILQVQVDRKTKVSATIFLKALGMSREEIQAAFEDVYESIQNYDASWIDINLINNTLDYDESRAFTTPVITKEDALKEMYRKVRAESGNADAAEAWLKSVYFDKKRYNLARVGRHKLNRKLGISVDENTTVLTKDDIVATMKYLLVFDLALKNKADITGNLSFKLKMQSAKTDVKIASDDIDDFQNRRIRSVGELIQNQVRIGLSRMERVVRERMSTQDVEAITPQTLVGGFRFLGLHRVGVFGPIGLARCEAGCGVLPDCRTVSLLGVLVLWVEPIFLGMAGHVSGHCLVCGATISICHCSKLMSSKSPPSH